MVWSKWGKQNGNSGYILFDTRDRIARITLNSPATLNGYHEAMLAEICAAMQTAHSLRAIPAQLLYCFDLCGPCLFGSAKLSRQTFPFSRSCGKIMGKE